MRKKFWLFLLLLSFLPHFCQASGHIFPKGVLEFFLFLFVFLLVSFIINIIAIIVGTIPKIKKAGFLWFTLSLNVLLFLLFFSFLAFGIIQNENYQDYMENQIKEERNFYFLILLLVLAIFIIIGHL